MDALKPLNDTWLSGKPYYCEFCGLGMGEYLACEEPDCRLESVESAGQQFTGHGGDSADSAGNAATARGVDASRAETSRGDGRMSKLTLMVPIEVEARPMTDGRTYLSRNFELLGYTSISEGEQDLAMQARFLGQLIECILENGKTAKADRSPEGGDAKLGSVEDESGGPAGICPDTREE